MNTKTRTLLASFVVASMTFMGSAIAGDEWYLLGQQTLKTANPSVEIKSEGNRFDKDVKQIKLTASGADVEITDLVLHWDNRRDDKLGNVGTLKSGGETAPMNAPGMKARLKSITVSYKILGDAPTADLKVMGYD
jgi:hypothetical protein